MRMHEKKNLTKNLSAFFYTWLLGLPSTVALYCTGPVWFVLEYEAGKDVYPLETVGATKTAGRETDAWLQRRG